MRYVYMFIVLQESFNLHGLLQVFIIYIVFMKYIAFYFKVGKFYCFYQDAYCME